VLNKNGAVGVYDDNGRELESYTPVIGAVISVPDAGRVKKGESFIKWIRTTCRF